ncbi:MAG TPA: hypothetical protein VFN29_08090 [Chiayiivirga sp.]|nr:hypothetical protein [Chiayiivirga sp.]
MLPLPSRRIAGASCRAQFPCFIGIESLSASDLTLARNYLQQLSARLEAQLIPTQDGLHDIALEYHGDSMRLFHPRHAPVIFPAPLRLPSLGEALGQLLSTVMLNFSPSGQPENLQELLLPNVRVAGPLLVRGAGFGDIVIGPLYRYAWTMLSRDELLTAISRSSGISEYQPIAFDEYRQIVNDRAHRPVSIEEICWALDTDAVLGPHRAHWAQRKTLTLCLSSWPNLSRQPDHEAWLRVLSRLSKPLTVAELESKMTQAGINFKESANKLILLVIFRHLRLSYDDTPTRYQPAQPVTTHTRVIARLRQHLRAMIS